MEELQALLRQAQDGDVDAYGQLVRRFQDMAVGYAYTVLGDFHLAEDAAQEAFIEAYHNLCKVYGPRAFLAWLRQIISRRLRKSPLAEWSGNLIISSGEEEIMLVIDRSDVKVKSGGTAENSIRGGQEIAQLIVGTETADEIVEMNQIRLSGKAQQLIEVLFPAQYPQMENQAL